MSVPHGCLLKVRDPCWKSGFLWVAPSHLLGTAVKDGEPSGACAGQPKSHPEREAVAQNHPDFRSPWPRPKAFSTHGSNADLSVSESVSKRPARSAVVPGANSGGQDGFVWGSAQMATVVFFGVPWGQPKNFHLLKNMSFSPS